MEKIITKLNTCFYVTGGKQRLVASKKSKTKLNGIIEIDGLEYKCVKANLSNLCKGCAFSDEIEGCVAHVLPCTAALRRDNQDCIFQLIESDSLEDKMFYSTLDFQELKSYRFK